MRRFSNAGDMLKAAGIGQYNTALSLPYVSMIPRTCDPYAQGVIQLVQGLQNALNSRGAHLELDGGLGPATAKEIAKYAGPRWYDKTWLQLYDDVLRGKKWQRFEKYGRGGHGVEEQLADYDYTVPDPLSGLVGDFFASPLPWVAGVFLLLNADKVTRWLDRHGIVKLEKWI